MSAATVIRLRSRFDNSLRSQTSSNSTRSVSSTSFGEKSPISFLAPSDGFGILDSSFHNNFSFSAADQLLQVFGIAGTLDWNFCGCRFQLAKIIGRELHVHSSKVFLQAMQLGRSRNGDYPWFLRKQPGERDLSRCCLLLVGKFNDQIDQCLIRIAIFFRKARDDISEIVLVELCVLADRAGKKALSEWAERHEADAKLFQGGNDLFLRFAPPQGVFTLQRRHGLHSVCPADCLRPGLRQSKVS